MDLAVFEDCVDCRVLEPREDIGVSHLGVGIGEVVGGILRSQLL
jgi:hypothetical protein